MKKLLVLSLILGFFTICCHVTYNSTLPADVKYVSADGPIPDREFLSQDWADSTRQKFWFVSQGSEIMPYRWFTWLEQPDNNKFFRNTEHMAMLGYLPAATSKMNPSGLPIGFAMTTADTEAEAYMGMTCAACHTNQIDYKGKKYLVDGAPTLANFVMFFERLVEALEKTQSNDEKFNRFALRVLGGSYTKAKAKELREDVLELAIATGQRQLVNRLKEGTPSNFTSYARLDAFGNIENAGSAFALSDLTNRNSPMAPVSYPFLWGTHQSDVVQWNASAVNKTIVGPLARNTGEVVGVFGGLEIKENKGFSRLFGKKHVYTSTVDFYGLGALEGFVKILRSPQWSETNFPPVDEQKVRDGAYLYGVHCSNCHQVIKREDEGLDYVAVKTKLTDVGTDPMMAWSVENHFAETLILAGAKTDIIVGDKFGDTTRSINIALNGTIGVILKNPVKAIEGGLITRDTEAGKSWEELVHEHTRTQDALLESSAASAKLTTRALVGGKDLSGLVYKARPLNGIWATAPYLHNGSVPNLWSLLQKPEERPKSFWVGSHEMDPVNVGFESYKGKDEFRVLDRNGKVQEGNSNAGHVYGTQLTDSQKWSIIEYMKTL